METFGSAFSLPGFRLGRSARRVVCWLWRCGLAERVLTGILRPDEAQDMERQSLEVGRPPGRDGEKEEGALHEFEWFCTSAPPKGLRSSFLQYLHVNQPP